MFPILIAVNSYAGDLMIFSGAGLMKPMEEMRTNFEKEHGISADVHYGGSGEIFGMLGAGQPCDVLIPGDEKYTMDAMNNGWVIKETIKKMVLHIPVLAVPKGNPAGVKSFVDLSREGVKVALGDPKGPAIGRLAKNILEKNKLWDSVQPNIEVYAPTVNQLLIYVALNQVDAAIVWEDLVTWAEGKGKIEVIRVPDEQNSIKTIPTSVCTKAQNMDLAKKFNDYISSKEGLEIWKKWGFEPCGSN